MRRGANDGGTKGLKGAGSEPDRGLGPVRRRCASGRREGIVGWDRITRASASNAARVRRFDAARQATGQLHVELPLQCANLLAERRLLHPQRLA